MATDSEPRPSPPRWPWLLLALTGVLFAALAGVQAPINDDESLHLHSIWMVGQGKVPYRDFFEFHFPGLWLIGSLFLRGDPDIGPLILGARAVMALTWGLTLYLLAMLIEARGLAIALLLPFMIVVASECEVFFVRAESFAVLLVIAHFVLLARATPDRGRRWAPVGAAALLSYACTMSLRSVSFLPLQPILAWIGGARRPREFAGWAIGLMLGILPSLIYLGSNGVLFEAWQWSVIFGLRPDAFPTYGLHPWTTLLWFAIAVALSVVFATRPHLGPPEARPVLLGATAFSGLFFIINPVPLLAYTELTFYLCSGAIAAIVIADFLERVPAPRGSAVRTATALALCGLAIAIAKPELFPMERDLLRAQFALLKWLDQTAGEDPVVLVSPHHPITVRDATDMQSGWHYTLWMMSPPVRARLLEFPKQVLERHPAVIAADPWLSSTEGATLLPWLWRNRVLEEQDAEALMAFITGNYTEVTFVPLDWQNGAPVPYGGRFWVRNDKLDPATVPQPARYGPPSFAAGSEAPVPLPATNR